MSKPLTVPPADKKRYFAEVLKGLLMAEPIPVGEALITGTLPNGPGLYVISFQPRSDDAAYFDDQSFIGHEVPWYVGQAGDIDARWEAHRRKLETIDDVSVNLQTNDERISGNVYPYDLSKRLVRTVCVNADDLDLFEPTAIALLDPIANGRFGGKYKKSEAEFWSFLGKIKDAKTLKKWHEQREKREPDWFQDPELISSLADAAQWGDKGDDAATFAGEPFPDFGLATIEPLFREALAEGDEPLEGFRLANHHLGPARAVEALWSAALDQRVMVSESDGVQLSVSAESSDVLKLRATHHAWPDAVARLDVGRIGGEGAEGLRAPLQSIVDWINDGGHPLD